MSQWQSNFYAEKHLNNIDNIASSGHQCFNNIIWVASHICWYCRMGPTSWEVWCLLSWGEYFLTVDNENYGFWCTVSGLVVAIKIEHHKTDRNPCHQSIVSKIFENTRNQLTWCENYSGNTWLYFCALTTQFGLDGTTEEFIFTQGNQNLRWLAASLFNSFDLHQNKSIYSQDKIPRKLSDKAHRRMKMFYDRRVNTTICDPDDWLQFARPRWHPNKQINPALIRWHYHYPDHYHNVNPPSSPCVTC